MKEKKDIIKHSSNHSKDGRTMERLLRETLVKQPRMPQK